MRIYTVFGCLFLFACNSDPEKPIVATTAKTDSAKVSAVSPSPDTGSPAVEDTSREELPAMPITKKPSGIYQFSLPLDDDKEMLQTVAFYPTTYRLQEEYKASDSTVITQGTWAPSEGAIWLYKDQILRGRYTWKGDTLQYYSPRLKKSFSTEKLTPALTNQVWQTKRKEGALLYGVGTEPFWSVEVTGQDSIVLNMPDWPEPLRARLTSADIAKDSVVYAADGDSIHVVVYPYFCSDGMSDFVYTRKLKLAYKKQTFDGCGELLRQNR